MKTEALKNCPFCGGPAYLETSHRAFVNGEANRLAVESWNRRVSA